jgi:glucose uptake protein GlcU
MKLKTLAGSAMLVALPFSASAATTVQSEAPLSAGVLLVGTALVAVAAFLMWRKA